MANNKKEVVGSRSVSGRSISMMVNAVTTTVVTRLLLSQTVQATARPCNIPNSPLLIVPLTER